jgi:hypothetical protein
MGFRFRKSWGYGPFRWTISKKGISSSVGIPGARLTVGKRGITRTSGIPGTGLYYTDTFGGRRRRGPDVDSPLTDDELRAYIAAGAPEESFMAASVLAARKRRRWRGRILGISILLAVIYLATRVIN